MIFMKVNDTLYPADITGKAIDREWDNRESKQITVRMDYATANVLFVDDLAWSIVERNEVPVYQKDESGDFVLDDNGNLIQIGTEVQEREWDNRAFTIAGDITDHRDGTLTAKMGKLTELEEAYVILLGGM